MPGSVAQPTAEPGHCDKYQTEDHLQTCCSMQYNSSLMIKTSRLLRHVGWSRKFRLGGGVGVSCQRCSLTVTNVFRSGPYEPPHPIGPIINRGVRISISKEIYTNDFQGKVDPPPHLWIRPWYLDMKCGKQENYFFKRSPFNP